MNISDLRGILQYVPRFREKIFVIEIDGDILASANFQNILLDLAVLRSLNIKVILVHGAARQIRELAAARSIAASNDDGTGVTDEATLALGVEAGVLLTNRLMEGLTAVDLRAAYANVIIAHPFGIRDGVDYLHTGKVERIDTAALQLFLDQGIIPVIPPLGFDGEGKTFRVNSDLIAYEVAEAMRATKMIYLTAGEMMTESGLELDGEAVRQLSAEEAGATLERLRRGKANGPAGVPSNILSKLEYGARACRNRIPRVHLLNGLVDEALLGEIFSHEGIGTMIYSNEYQQIRRVLKKDVRGLMELIAQSVHNQELISRNRGDILAHIEDYWLLEVDRALVGCVALHPYPAEGKGELACLYVHKDHSDQGYGQKLMAFVERLAQEKGLQKIFALSTQTFSFFQQKGGYVEVPVDELPPGRRERYEANNRRSKVLQKELPTGRARAK